MSLNVLQTPVAGYIFTSEKLKPKDSLNLNKISFSGKSADARKIINKYVAIDAVITGLASQVPMAGPALNSTFITKMTKKLAKLYNIPASANLHINKAIGAAIAEVYVCTTVASTFKYFPVVGNIANGAYNATLVKAVGRIFKKKFAAVENHLISPDKISIDVKDLKRTLKSLYRLSKMHLTQKAKKINLAGILI